MITSKDVFAKRKTGDIDEAYSMAKQLIKISEHDDWNIKAYAWCVIDLIKRDANSGLLQKLPKYHQELDNLEISIDDDILTKQRIYALNLCKPGSQLILQAKELSKAGQHSDSADLYRKIINNGDSSIDVQTGLAWELYRVLKLILDEKEPDFNLAKRYLNDYLKLNVEKPSLLHTCFLQIAVKLSKEGRIKMGAFVKIWNLEYLRSDEYEQYKADDGKIYPSLAEKVIQHASKDASYRKSLDDLEYIFPYVIDSIKRFPNNMWLKLNRTKALLGLEKYDDALLSGIEVVKNKNNDYWSWELLGDIHQYISKELALACYCKALLCSKDLNFVGKVKSKLADLLICNNDYSRARFELDEIISYKKENSQKITDEIKITISQGWYEETKPSPSNDKFYRDHAPIAESILYSKLPWINGVLGDTFTIKNKPNKPKRKLFIADINEPVEVSVFESRFSLNNMNYGDAIKVKGEYDNEQRFQVYTIVERESDIKWDIFNEKIGMVDHVNNNKQVLHFIVDRYTDGVIPFSQLNSEFSEGDAISVCLSKCTTKDGVKYRVVIASDTDETISDSLLKKFEEEVSESKGMGFTDSNIFLPASLMEKNNIQNLNIVSGTAIINYNKKRMEWGWKAISISDIKKQY